MRVFVAELARMYWKTAHQHDDEQIQAWEAVEALSQLPHAGARILVALARHADTEDRQCYLGAGPLEDLVDRGRPDDLEIIEAALSDTPELRRALLAVNEPDNPSAAKWLVAQRIAALRASESRPRRTRRSAT